jgi:sensor histidine kinase regulating citrate/malate metabolism
MLKMINSNVIRAILFVSIAAVIVLPIYTVFFIYPMFSKLTIKHSENEAERIATHLASLLVTKNDMLDQKSIPDDISIKINELKRVFDFLKIKVYSRSGEIIYSTNSEDIGVIHTGTEFEKIATKGSVSAKFRQKDTTSDEGETLTADVVETYVPIMSDERFIGAFEIYYHVKDRKERFDGVILSSSIKIFIAASCLLAVVILVSFKADRSITEQEHARADREVLIAELQDSIDKVKHIPLMIPICASCKKIRDDQGDWKQVADYFQEKSEIKFTHGLCPACTRIIYPEIS